jgi:hypothetical protein
VLCIWQLILCARIGAAVAFTSSISQILVTINLVCPLLIRSNDVSCVSHRLFGTVFDCGLFRFPDLETVFRAGVTSWQDTLISARHLVPPLVCRRVCVYPILWCVFPMLIYRHVSDFIYKNSLWLFFIIQNEMSMDADTVIDFSICLISQSYHESLRRDIHFFQGTQCKVLRFRPIIATDKTKGYDLIHSVLTIHREKWILWQLFLVLLFSLVVKNPCVLSLSKSFSVLHFVLLYFVFLSWA